MHQAYHHIIKHRKSSFRDRGGKKDRYHLKEILDSLVYISALFGAILNIPQLARIWIDREISGVSTVTWIGFLLGSSFWLFYGIVHREKPIILANAVYVCIQLMIVVGLFVHGGSISLW